MTCFDVCGRVCVCVCVRAGVCVCVCVGVCVCVCVCVDGGRQVTRPMWCGEGCGDGGGETWLEGTGRRDGEGSAYEILLNKSIVFVCKCVSEGLLGWP